MAIGGFPSIPVGIVNILDASTGQIIQSMRDEDGVYEITWSPDGTLLAAACLHAGDPSRDAVIIWDAATGEEIRRIQNEYTPGVSSSVWSPDGNRIATAGNIDDTARIWDVNTGNLLATLQGHADIVGTVTWSPDSTKLATGAQDGTIQVWDASSGQLLNTFPSPESIVSDIAWNSNGSQIAIIGVSTAQILDVATGQVLATFPGREAIDWNPDGTLVAVGQITNQIAIYTSEGVLVSTNIPSATFTPTPTLTATPRSRPTASATATVNALVANH